MPESIQSKSLRWYFNFFPAYRGTGARILYIDQTFREVRIKLPLNWRTRNHHNAIFGGSMYAAIDPVYAMMLHLILGRKHTLVWTKTASIRFKSPGKSTLYASFLLDPHDIEIIKNELLTAGRVERNFTIELKDCENKTHFIAEQTVHISYRAELIPR